MADEREKKVDRIINDISEREEVSWSEARTMVHKYLCGGKCGGYKTEGKKAGFDRHDLTEEQEELIEETVKQVMKDLTVKEAQWQIHRILCPGHLRPHPRKKQ